MSTPNEYRAYEKLGEDFAGIVKAAIEKYDVRLAKVEKENEFMRDQMYYLMSRLKMKDLLKKEEDFEK